jgi:hypothetical protein
MTVQWPSVALIAFYVVCLIILLIGTQRGHG